MEHLLPARYCSRRKGFGTGQIWQDLCPRRAQYPLHGSRVGNQEKNAYEMYQVVNGSDGGLWRRGGRLGGGRKGAGWACYFWWLIRLSRRLSDIQKATLWGPGQHIGLLRTFQKPRGTGVVEVERRQGPVTRDQRPRLMIIRRRCASGEDLGQEPHDLIVLGKKKKILTRMCKGFENKRKLFPKSLLWY